MSDGVDLFPVWSGPPFGVAGGLVGVGGTVGRSQSVAVDVELARAYPEGVVVRLTVVQRDWDSDQERPLMRWLMEVHGRGHTMDPSGQGLAWGFHLADGSTVANTDESPWADGEDPAPGRSVLEMLAPPSPRANTWSREHWLWPLPPEGPLTAHVAWPAQGIEPSTLLLPTAGLRRRRRPPAGSGPPDDPDPV